MGSLSYGVVLSDPRLFADNPGTSVSTEARRFGGLRLGLFLFGWIVSGALSGQTDSWREQLWSLPGISDQEAGEAAIRSVLEGAAGFESLYEALEHGPVYSDELPRGVVEGTNETSDGASHHFAWVIPDSYDPAVPTAVRFMLHGGVSTSNRRAGVRGPIDNLRVLPLITVLPSAWREAPWWTDAQVENLSAILGELKRQYNVDDNRVFLAGISDGAAGCYYVAMRDTTPWAAFLPLIGDPEVLRSAARGTALRLANLRNKPLFAVNTVDDPLYPSSRIAPLVEDMQRLGIDVELQVQEGFAHNTNWWPLQRENMNRFLLSSPRRPHPERVEWWADGERFGRAHWLGVLTLGDRVGSLTAEVEKLAGRAFSDARLAVGGVVGERVGNEIRIATTGVARLRVLLSPAFIDFTLPVRILIDGNEVFLQVVRPDPRVLIDWWLRDQDRRMLYGAEVAFVVPQH